MPAQATVVVSMDDLFAANARYARKIQAQLIVVGHLHLEGWPAHGRCSCVSRVSIGHAPRSVFVVA